MPTSADDAILLVELGRVPSYLWINLSHLRSVNPKARIVLATDQALADHPVLSLLRIEYFELDAEALMKLGPEGAAFSTRYRKRFWYFTSLRFLALLETIARLKIERCIHVESDYLLYVRLEEILNRIPEDCDLGVCCEVSRVIPGLMFVRGEAGAAQAWRCVAAGLDRGLADFDALQALFDHQHPGVYAFPTEEWLDRPGMHGRRLLDLGSAVMDAASLGQFILGTDRRPFRSHVEVYTALGKDDLVYFENPARSDQPMLRKGGRHYPIWGLHTHAKRLECLATFAGDLEPISGCRCLEWADWVACLNDGFAYASRVGLEPAKLLLVGEGSPVPTPGAIVAVSGDEVYRLPENWLLRVRELGGLVFLVVNSDRDHEASALARLIGPKNIAFAQNLLATDVEHPNVRPLPIGVQNRIWPEINVLSSMTSRARKYFGVLSALSSTHRSRVGAVFWSLVMATRLPHLEKPLEIRIHRVMGLIRSIYRALCTRHIYGYRMPVNRWRRLIRGSFFVLSLRGNGADTHRFWEGQYHGSIPLLRPVDDLPAYLGWPRLIRRLAPILLRRIRQQDITEAMSKRDVRLIRGAQDYERDIRCAAKALGEIHPR